MDVAGGAIRAAASAPRFDPNLFVHGDQSELAALLDDPAGPLFDRVSRMALPPGSVFKTILGVAALEEGAIRTRSVFTCTHRFPVGRRYFECLGQHGSIDFEIGLYKSCNIYFYHTGLALEKLWEKNSS